MPTVLILAASPLDQDHLRVGAELRDIRHALKRSKNREDWTIESNEAVTADDLRRAMLDYQPTVVHFAGHGAGDAGLCLEDSDGNTSLATAESLTKLFHHFKDNLKCVVLNACYSDIQAQKIRSEIDYVVGMSAAVGDQPAAKFAVAFYDSIFAGMNFRTSFDLACTTLDLNNLPDADVPVFLTAPHLGEIRLAYSAKIPEIERILDIYFNTPFADRGKFTTSGDAITPTMIKHYGERVLTPRNKTRVLNIDHINDDRWRVVVSVGGAMDTIYMYIRDRSALIDWEATVGLWSLPYKNFVALGSTEPVLARVDAELGTYYNFEYAHLKSRFQAIELRNKSGDLVYGYVQKHTDTHTKLMKILEDGNSHSITVSLRTGSNEQTNMALILDLVSDTWIINSPNPQTPENEPTINDY